MDSTSLQAGDCILFSGKGFVSRGIKFFTDSKWTHAAIYVGGGEGFVIEATAAGVEKNPLAPLLKKASAYCVRRIPDLTVEQAELMKEKAYGLIYEEYDFVQLVSLGIYYAFRKIGISCGWLVRNAPGKMICSELYAVCALCVPLKFKSKTKLVTPAMLYETRLMTTVEEFENK